MESKISPGLSLYLDAARFLAAVSVLLYHTWTIFYPDSPIKWPGHEAVVIFFVLSGFVIAHATDRPSVTWRVYLQHRAARILPVAYAALLLSVVMAFVVPPGGAMFELVWKPLVANLAFLAQSAHVNLGPVYNAPMWSLNYEVWYYIIFGLWLYAPANRRLLFVALACLVAGPRILLLMPVWLFGVCLYHRMPRIPVLLAWLLVCASVALMFVTTANDVSGQIRAELYRVFPPAWRLHYSSQFIYDILMGVVVAANFAAMAALCRNVRVGERAAAGVRYLASFTFSTYVFHGPLTILLRDALGIGTPLPFYALMALAIFVLGQLTERRTAFYRALFSRTRRPPALQPA